MKRPGRPRIAPEEASVDVHFRLPATQRAQTQRQAQQARLTYAEWLRQMVAKALPKHKM